MAWLQSSFTNHHLIGESDGNPPRKGYKVGSLKKNTDPDKCDTPLLLDGPILSTKPEDDMTNWFNNGSAAERKKTGILQNITSKPSFLSSSFFDRSANVVKTKPLSSALNQDSTASGSMQKPREDKNLLSFLKSEKPQVEEDEDDSEDEWFSPHASRGYQRVKTG